MIHYVTFNIMDINKCNTSPLLLSRIIKIKSKTKGGGVE